MVRRTTATPVGDETPRKHRLQLRALRHGVDGNADLSLCACVMFVVNAWIRVALFVRHDNCRFHLLICTAKRSHSRSLASRSMSAAQLAPSGAGSE